jgi:hypothetical protein
MNNLIIAYDLDKPGQDYKKIEDAIRSLGTYGKFQLSVWWVQTHSDEVQIRNFLLSKIDSNDRLLVVNATRGGIAWCNPIATNSFINEHWNSATV